MPGCWNYMSRLIYDLSFDNVKTFLPVIDVVILLISNSQIEHSFKTVERLHQNQWQYIDVKKNLCFTMNSYQFIPHTLLGLMVRYAEQFHGLAHV